LSTGDPDASAFERIDVTTAHPARRYNYWLGGKDHFAADRASGDAIEAVLPSIRLMAIENRMSLRRAVRYVARQGIRQYLDIGTGIPAPGNTHEIAQGVDPTARTVYVDNDPIVLAHARALLTSAPQGTNAYLDADLREPCSILEHPDLKATLDFSEPITLMLVAVLHFIRDDEDPRGIVDRLGRRAAARQLRHRIPRHVGVPVAGGDRTAFRRQHRRPVRAPQRGDPGRTAARTRVRRARPGLGLPVASRRRAAAPASIEDVSCNGVVARIP
jgi:hypothetical protein